MRRLRLIHWNEGEARERARHLEKEDLEVDASAMDPAGMQRLKQNPPDLLLIDLGRMPSQGRDLAIHLRRQSTTREIPLIFLEGEAKKVEAIRKILPDAIYSSWAKADEAIRRASRKRTEAVVVPDSDFAAYAGRALSKKLGIQPESSLMLISPPTDVERILDPLPEGVTLRRRAQGVCDLAIWFVQSRGELEKRIGNMHPHIGRGGLWIAWPKKASGAVTDLNQSVVRKTGLDSGLVDYKICSIDATWSALRFAIRAG